MNAPSRFELFELDAGEAKLTVVEDTKIPNAATITINKEDHTLANMLKTLVLPLYPLDDQTNDEWLNSQLEQLDYVIFSGYRVPHPLEPACVIKVQTNGSKTPIEAVQDACQKLLQTLAEIKRNFQGEIIKAKGRGGDVGMGAGEDEFDFNWVG